MTDIEAIRARHVVSLPSVGNESGHRVDYCAGCRAMWPCDTRKVLDTLGSLNRGLAALAHENADEMEAARADADRLAEALRQVVRYDDVTSDVFASGDWSDIAHEWRKTKRVVRQALAAHDAVTERLRPVDGHRTDTHGSDTASVAVERVCANEGGGCDAPAGASADRQSEPDSDGFDETFRDYHTRPAPDIPLPDGSEHVSSVIGVDIVVGLTPPQVAEQERLTVDRTHWHQPRAYTNATNDDWVETDPYDPRGTAEHSLPPVEYEDKAP